MRGQEEREDGRKVKNRGKRRELSTVAEGVNGETTKKREEEIKNLFVEKRRGEEERYKGVNFLKVM